MQKILRAKIEDLAGVKRLFRRVDANQLMEGDDFFDLGYPDDLTLKKAIEEGRLVIAKEGRFVKGAFLYSFSLYDSFYPKSQNSQKIEAIYETAKVKEEMLLVIDIFVVDPNEFASGLAYQLLNFLFLSYKVSSIFIAIPTSNLRACHFFYRYGFSTIQVVSDLESYNKKESYLMVRRYKKPGLASLEF